MATKKIIVVPCMVNIRLNTSGETKTACGTANWTRMITASRPAMTRNTSAYTMYIRPSFLWSTVISHSCIVSSHTVRVWTGNAVGLAIGDDSVDTLTLLLFQRQHVRGYLIQFF